MVGLGGPSKSSGRQKWHPKSTNCCQKARFVCPGAHFLCFRKTLKHGKTPSGLDLRFVYVLVCFEFSSFSGTVVKENMRLRQIHRETPTGSALRNPVGAKMAHKIYQVQWLHVSSLSARLSAFMKPSAPKTPPKRPEVSFLMI